MVWHSPRTGDYNIWFGIPGEREDLNPPPYVSSTQHQPSPNPDSDDTITFRAWAQDETGVANVDLVWTLNGAAQRDLPMFDDGAHGDDGVGDGVWGAQPVPLPAGSQVTYRARATDIDGNTHLYPYQKSFTVLEPFAKAADILFVPDNNGSDTSGTRSFYINALDSLGYTYDMWDTGTRSLVPGSVLNQYTGGVVIWSVSNSYGYVTQNSTQRTAVQDFLTAGGKLFISGQNIAARLNGNAFLTDYLHATYMQDDTGLYALVGTASDPIGDSLALNLSGGDGANNQSSKDEVDAISPALAVLTYQSGLSQMLRPPVAPADSPADDTKAPAYPSSPDWPDALKGPEQPTPTAMDEVETPQGISGSGTAGLRVDTGIYKVIYFAFGFEGINSQANRNTVMVRVLSWLGMPPPPPAVDPTKSTDGLELRWVHRDPSIQVYKVYRGPVPFSQPSEGGSLELGQVSAPALGETASFFDDTAYDPPLTNWYYLVTGLKSGGEQELSNPVGSFNFGLVSGTQ